MRHKEYYVSEIRCYLITCHIK